MKKEEQMSPGKGILLTTLLIPGLIVLGTSIYLFNRDYSSLVRAENYVENLVRRNRVGDRELEFAYHRAGIIRMNVLKDQAWGLIGGVISAIGIHGLVTMKEDSKRSS